MTPTSRALPPRPAPTVRNAWPAGRLPTAPGSAKVVSLAIVTLLSWIFPMNGAGQEAAPGPEVPVAFVGGTIIDGNGGPPLEGATLVVQDRRIRELGPQGRVAVPRGARVIDAAGLFLVPGFVDTNVHVSLYGRGETVIRYADRNKALALEAAQLHLKHGVTTIRDSYGSLLPLLEVRDEIARGEAIGPRILAAGNIVGWGGPCSVSFSLIRESECSLFEEQFNDFITQGSGEELMNMTPDELRIAIDAYLDKGPDFLKYGGTAHFSPAFIGFSPDAQQVIVEETHRRGLVAETHSTTLEGLRLSILAGIDLIQHPEALGDREITDELVGMIHERGIICSMLTNTYTGKVWAEHVEAKDKAAETEQEREEDLEQLGRERTSAEERKAKRDAGLAMEIRRRNAQTLIQGGCTTTVGTDNYLGTAPEFRREPKAENQEAGMGTIIAIEGLVELGMTPSQAIVAGTRNGALAARGLDDYGTLEVGKLADLLVLEENPLEDIHAIRKLAVVMKEGAIIDVSGLPSHPVWFRPPTRAESGADEAASPSGR